MGTLLRSLTIRCIAVTLLIFPVCKSGHDAPDAADLFDLPNEESFPRDSAGITDNFPADPGVPDEGTESTPGSDLSEMDAPPVADLGSPDDSGGPDAPDLADLSNVPDLPAFLDALPDVPEPSDAADDVAKEIFDPVPGAWPLGTVTRICGKGFLAGVDTPSGPVRIVVLRGTPWEVGFQDGCLNGADVGKFYQPFWALFMAEILAEASEYGLDPDQVEMFVTALLDSIWKQMLPFVPAQYLEERDGFLAGIAADPEAAALWQGSDPAQAWTALLLLSNLSDMHWGGKLEDIAQKLSDGFSPALLAWYSGQANAGDPRADWFSLPMRTTCSFFAAFNQRTAGGHLLASRNLDWSSDTGMANLAALVFRAPNVGHPYVSIGYAGFPGALAGMNARGLVVSEVGSTSAMERLAGEPWVLKFRDVLQHADSAQAGLDLLTGQTGDAKLRPPTIGYNWMLGFGDPPGGQSSEAAILETNGLAIGVHRHRPDCSVDTQLIRYGKDGAVTSVITHEAEPFLVNREADAVEIDKNGNPRKFQVDLDGKFVLDGNGLPVPDPEGQPFPVGRPLACALFRGDEALMHGIRRWQYAANGPQGSGGLMVTSGSYRHRYEVMRGALLAYETGTAYDHAGKTWVEDNGGVPVPLTLTEAERIARASAMSSNVMSIAYDATERVIAVSFEKGTGDQWESAAAHEHFRFELGPAFELLEGTVL